MISTDLAKSLASIIADTDIYDYYQLFAYMQKDGTNYKIPKNIITYRENFIKIWGKGRKYLKETPLKVFKYKYETRYIVNTTIETLGTNALTNISKIVRVISNNEDNFINNNLGIIGYETIKNLTFLENGSYKERYSIDINFLYIDTFINLNSEYLIKEAEFELVNADNEDY